MSGFYKPTSKDMAQVFDAQLSEIGGLLDMTRAAEQTAGKQQDTLSDTQKQVQEQVKTLKKFNDLQKEQIQTLEKTKDENDKLIQEGASKANDGLAILVNQFSLAASGAMNRTFSIDDLLPSAEFSNLYDEGRMYSGKISSAADNELLAHFTDAGALSQAADDIRQKMYRQAAYDAAVQFTADQINADAVEELKKAQAGLVIKEQPGDGNQQATGGDSSSKTTVSRITAAIN
ncbi:hypothetical protein QS257_02610 [Terrilactibacillus sp. S3-3]|nr:hypothetical protein QS257_02610 [Terrilactibacillus sp. S3-3]